MSGSVNCSVGTNEDYLLPSGEVKFKIVSARIVEEPGQKKHVVRELGECTCAT